MAFSVVSRGREAWEDGLAVTIREKIGVRARVGKTASIKKTLSVKEIQWSTERRLGRSGCSSEIATNTGGCYG